jgi:glycosyltransferase involved in cell wall biosynthesis
VLQVAARFFPDFGGIETHVFEVARRINGYDGVSVDVLTTDLGSDRPAEEVVAGVRVARVPAWPPNRDYYLAPQVARRLAGYDLIHCQGVHTFVPVIAMAAARRRRLPYLITPHTGGHSSWLRHRARALQWRALGPLLRDARRMICVAEFEARMFVREAGIDPARILVVPNGVEPPPAVPARRGDGPPTIASVGRFVRYKGHHHILAALPHVLERFADARLLLVGRGPYEEELRRLARRLGVADNVDLVYVPPAERGRMAELLAGADVVALMSTYEAHPVALMEAVAMGRPVVVGRGSGLSELAAAGQARAVHRPDDPVEVARALCRELVDPLRLTGTSLPTWEDCARRTAETYRAAIEEP